ncbi:MAG: hypothetical protein ACRDDI_13670 [Aeromonas veronii]
MNIFKKHGPAIFQGILLVSVVTVSCVVSIKNSGDQVRAYNELTERVAHVQGQINALVEYNGLAFVEDPDLIRPERESK